MEALFDEYYSRAKKTGDFDDVLLIGQNIFNKKPNDSFFFYKYFEMLMDCCDLRRDDALITYTANVISVFSEKCELDSNTIKYIRECENRVNNLIKDSRLKLEVEVREKAKKKILENDNIISLIANLVDKLEKVTNEQEYSNILEDMTKLDAQLDENDLIDRQKNTYTFLTKKSSNIIEEKMQYFSRKKNIQYNLDAIKSYEKVFNYLKTGVNEGYSINTLKEMFEYEPSRLFNETIVYYNYVYNYLLGKLSDDDKYALTKLAIACEKKR